MRRTSLASSRTRYACGLSALTTDEPDMEAFMELVERAINGVELPDYAGVPDSGVPAGPSITLSARP